MELEKQLEKLGALRFPKRESGTFLLPNASLKLKLKPIKCLGPGREKLTIVHIQMWLMGVSVQRMILHQECEVACPLFQKKTR